jgi:hypothetical protein
MISVVFGDLESGYITQVEDRSDDNFRSGNYLYLDEGSKVINTYNYYKFYLAKNENDEVILLEKEVLDIKPDKLTAKIDEVITIKNNSKVKPVNININKQSVELSKELKLSFSIPGRYNVFLASTHENAKIYMEEFTIEVKDA